MKIAKKNEKKDYYYEENIVYKVTFFYTYCVIISTYKIKLNSMEIFMTEFEQRVDFYKQRRARNISIAIMLYILSVVAVIAFPCFLPYRGGILGVLVMLSMIACATGLIVYTAMSIPRDVADVLSKNKGVTKEVIAADGTKTIYREESNPILTSIFNLYWIIVTIIYLSVSFITGAWGITWLIWLIATAIEQALKILFMFNNKKTEKLTETSENLN